MVQVIDAQHVPRADLPVLELVVYADRDQVSGVVIPVADKFHCRSGHVERMYLYALDLCRHHAIPVLLINDPACLFPAELRPEPAQPSEANPQAPEGSRNPEPPDLRRGPISADTLTWFGFQHVAFWHLRPDREQIQLRGNVDGRPAVYLFLVGGEVRFVGAAHGGLRQILDHYARFGRTQSAVRIRRAIIEESRAGRTVHVLAQSFSPVIRDLDGLPIDQVAGLQAGLRRILQPPWNALDMP